MHLITDVLVTVAIGIHGNTINTHVKGCLNMETIVLATNMDIGVQYAYADADNADAILKSSTKVITEAEQQALYQTVKDTLPDINTSFAAWYQALLYEAFRFEMAATFQIDPSQISIVA